MLARTAAMADAAATMIANAVDLPGSPKIKRARADSLRDDCDLGHRLVTVGVGQLNIEEKRAALARGRALAGGLCTRGLVAGAALAVQGEAVICGDMAVAPALTRYLPGNRAMKGQQNHV